MQQSAARHENRDDFSLLNTERLNPNKKIYLDMRFTEKLTVTVEERNGVVAGIQAFG